MPADAVTLAYVHRNDVATSFQQSLRALDHYDLAGEGRLLRGGWIAARGGSDGLPAARNRVVAEFLADKDAPWLLWLDTDMGFGPDLLERLLEAADPTERPVVGALCFVQRERLADGMGGWRCSPAPTIYDWTVTTDGARGFVGRSQYPVNTLVQCAGTGSAALLIHRSVFERIAEQHGPVWYDRVPNPTTGGQLVGEDLSFCLRVGAAGIPIHVHTGVRTSHFKHLWLAEADYWAHAVAPPATEEVAVLVPVLDRPEHAEPFMRSLRASTGLATVYAICDTEDEAATTAWKQAGAIILHGQYHDRAAVLEGDYDTLRPGTFAEKVNLGYRESDEPWVLLVGSDVRFHAGWWDHAQAVAGEKFHVVGTNDLGNPRVMAGEHATHLLIRRSYIDEQGACWDGPGVVAHEGYRHWFVDDEIVTVARQRGVWAMALGSLIEHLHPYFGKGDHDEVYELGESRAEADREVFEARCRTHLGLSNQLAGGD